MWLLRLIKLKKQDNSLKSFRIEQNNKKSEDFLSNLGDQTLMKILFYASLVFWEMVNFFNTINYLATQMNNETSFKNTTTKGLL